MVCFTFTRSRGFAIRAIGGDTTSGRHKGNTTTTITPIRRDGVKEEIKASHLDNFKQ